MPWFKVDDGLHCHPKAFRAGTAALGLWVRAGSWCAQTLTDGFVPDAIARAYGTPQMAAALVTAGLWARVDGGYQFHEWNDDGRNLTREEVRAEREKKAAAGRAGGKASGASRRSNAEARASRLLPDVEADASRIVADSSNRPLNPNTNTKPGASAKHRETTPGGVVVSGVADDHGRVSSELALRPDDNRPEIQRLCDHLASRIRENGSRNPVVGKAWRTAARLMLDRDGLTEEQIHRAIDWCQDDEFWRSNILGMPKLREKYDQLRQHARRGDNGAKRMSPGDRALMLAANYQPETEVS